VTTTKVLGTCHHDCPDSCGWIATVTDGVAVELRGNPDHPYSRGELCPKVNRFLDRVYHPDRILTPLRRTGAKGEGRFEAVSWDEALAEVAERLHAVIDRWGGEAILPWRDAGTQGLLQETSLDRRFFDRLGASRQVGSLCGATARAGTTTTLGSGRACDPSDVRHAEVVLLWGTNTLLTNRHLWPFVEEARGNSATVVVIDPLRTATAERADWFLQPLPGTDVALMLGLIHVLVRDDLLDHDYIDRYTSGFDELAERAAAWPPARAAAACGLDAADVERLAALYGSTRKAFIRTLIGAEHHERGAMFFRTLSCLPALTGAWRERGGGYSRSVSSWFDDTVDAGAYAAAHLRPAGVPRSISMNHLGRALTDASLDPPVRALFVWNGNPVVTVPNAALTRQGLANDDLLCVVSEQFLTDTARYADIVFPATTQLEQLDVVPAWGHLYLGWNEPAIAPLGEAVPNTELWRRLARAMGFTEPELFSSDEELLTLGVTGVDLESLRREGWVRLDLPDDLRPYASGGFATASGRAELGGSQTPDHVPAVEGPALPGVTSDTAGAGDRPFPLQLLTPKVHTRFLNSSYGHLAAHAPVEGGPFVEIHPDDAATRGIADGDRVLVHNDRATLTLPARLGIRVRPGVVAVPFGWSSDAHGERATANSLTNDTLTDWGGGVAYSSTLVEVSRLP
jgi:anaerobic selenocysteine-containing dehydrogenase